MKRTSALAIIRAVNASKARKIDPRNIVRLGLTTPILINPTLRQTSNRIGIEETVNEEPITALAIDTAIGAGMAHHFLSEGGESIAKKLHSRIKSIRCVLRHQNHLAANSKR